jgi:deoxyribose-phosphate aldolase
VVAAVRETPGPAPAEARQLKVILETALLDDRQKVAGALLAVAAGADFVKTSTGFAAANTAAGLVNDVRLLRAALGPSGPGRRIKASGGIADRATALALLAAGADRLGCSATGAILRGG